VLQIDQILAQLKIIDGDATRSVLKRQQFLINSTTNPSSHSYFRFSPNPMSNKTLMQSLEPFVTSIGKSVDRPMTKTNDVSQSKNLTIIANKLDTNVGDRKVILKAKVDVA
jgi:hypothetical protein